MKRMSKLLCICLSFVLIMQIPVSAGRIGELVGPPSVGDINGDGKCDAEDALNLLWYAANKKSLETSVGMCVYADIDGDRKITAVDALFLLKKAAKLVDEFPDISDTTTIKDQTYDPEEIQPFINFLSLLKPLYVNEGEPLRDSTGNICYHLEPENFEIESWQTHPIYDTTRFSWFNICDIDRDGALELILVDDSVHLYEESIVWYPLCVELYLFEMIDGKMTNTNAFETYKRNSLLYFDTDLGNRFDIDRTVNVHPFNDSPVDTLRECYIK